MPVKNGTEVLIDKQKRSAQKLLNKNLDKTYLKSYLNYLGETKSWSTKNNYIRYVVNFMNYTKKEPSELTLDDYVNYLAEVQGVSSYRIPIYHALQNFSRYLYASDRCKKDYMQSVSRPAAIEEISTIERRSQSYLTDEEVAIVLATVRQGVITEKVRRDQAVWTKRDIALIMLLLSTGLRCSAIIQLDVDSIDVKKGTLITFEKGRKPVEKYLPKSTCQALQSWIMERDVIMKLEGIFDEKALFISTKKQRMTAGGVNSVIQKYTANIPGKKISAHKFRATYGSKLLEQTGDIYMVQKAMNHSSPKTTELYIRGQQDKVNEKQRDVMQNFLENF